MSNILPSIDRYKTNIPTLPTKYQPCPKGRKIMSARKTIEEVEDALRELVLLRTSHHGDDAALQLVDEFLVGLEPHDEAQRREELQRMFRQLRRHRRPVVVKVF